MYRSFVTCDDPKGVVECKIIRKFKGCKSSEAKIKHHRVQKNLNPSTKHNEDGKDEKVSGGIAENPSFFQVMEVSKEAQKLNNPVTDSWAKEVTFDCHSTQVARDLLKGALDLQESLVMLGKIEAASYIAKLKKKSKEKSPSEKFDDMVSEMANSDEDFQNGYQKPRASTSESSRDCYDELRQSIKDSFARQNMLPKSCSKEKACGGDGDTYPTTTLSKEKPAYKKIGSPNLIAKLMGLEEFPHTQLKSSPRKQVEIEMISNQRRPLFEMDMPKMRKTEVVFQKGIPPRRTLKEVLETLQYNERFKPPFHHFSECSEQGSNDVGEQIVVMKPIRSSLPEEGECYKQMYSEERRGLDTKDMIKRLKIKEKFPPKAIEFSRERVLDERPRHKVAKEKRVGTKEKTKETIQKNAEKTQKVVANRRKPVETENAKSKGVYGPQVHAKTVARKLNNPKEVSNATKNRTTRQKRTTSSPLKVEHTTPTVSRTSTAQKSKMKKEKAVMKPLAANSTKKVQNKNATTKGNNTIVENKRNDVSNEEEVDSPNNHVKELPNDSQCSASEVKLQTTQPKSNPSSSEEAKHCIGCDNTENKFFKTTINQKHMLLSSPSFINRAEELFNISKNHQPINFQAEGGDIDYEMTETRLFLDCANELMELKILHYSGTSNLLSRASFRNRHSLDLLAEEICDGVERLRSYSKLVGENCSVDNLIGVMERDLLYKGVVISGSWDLGWREGFSWDEIEQVVFDIEKLLLSSLLEEVFTVFGY